MGMEIEHKFLVKNNSYREKAYDMSEIKQGFLSRNPERTVRVRVRDGKGYLTITGKGTGAVHPEFEYEVPLKDALQLMDLCEPPVIEKTRYLVMHDCNRWEIDEFHGALEGLIIAELEVPDEDHVFKLPAFVGKEVTGDPRYYNSQMGLMT